MSPGKILLALSLGLVLCGLLGSISCELQRGRLEATHSLRRQPSPNQDTKVGHEVFAQNLLKTLLAENPKENIVFSPMSVSISLAMVSEGARSGTLVNLLQVLGFDVKDLEVWNVHQSFLSYIQRLHQLSKKHILKHGDFLFINHHRRIEQRFLEKIQKLYNVHMHMIDCSNKEKAWKELNHDVTKKIQDRALEPITSPDPQTFLYLINCITFRGVWQVGFDTKLTQKETFIMDKNKKVQVDMMRKMERMLYSRWDNVQSSMVELPHIKDLSVVLMLPDEGPLDSLLSRMDLWKDRILHATDMRWAEIILPKFKITSKIDLKKVLPKLGLRDLVTTEANFSGITEEVFPASIEAVHEAQMEVNEKGVRMAVHGATGVRGDSLLQQPAEPLCLKFNRPFRMFVVDNKAHAQLLTARVLDPTAESWTPVQSWPSAAHG